eukprot:6212226-Pleurochrysis_carterae.AAC.2
MALVFAARWRPARPRAFARCSPRRRHEHRYGSAQDSAHSVAAAAMALLAATAVRALLVALAAL